MRANETVVRARIVLKLLPDANSLLLVEVLHYRVCLPLTFNAVNLVFGDLTFCRSHLSTV